MSASDSPIPRLVRMFTAQGETHGWLEVLAYCDAPTYQGRSDGCPASWRADLCESATPEQEATYWREQCAALRARLAKTVDLVERQQDQNARLLERLEDAGEEGG